MSMTAHTHPHGRFLRDVLICSLGAYGGPEAHMSVFMDQMVVKRNYLDEKGLVELIALCSMLPGPTSTQTIVSIGYKTGGPMLALLTLLVWAVPAIIMMTVLSFLYALLSSAHLSSDVLRFISPMAVGFIIVAAWRIGRKVITDSLTALLFCFGALTTYFSREPWIFPLVLLVGGAVSIAVARHKNIWNRISVRPPWRYLLLFCIFTVGAVAAGLVTADRLPHLFEHFYRYGYLVFGGGQVVVPVMHAELVDLRHYMTNDEFMTGYGLVQGLPGPMFSFAAYAGGMASRGNTMLFQIVGALIGGISIFLPGVLLIFFVYPVWEQVKAIKAVTISLKGINAVAGGMIAAAAVILLKAGGIQPLTLTVAGVTAVLLALRRIPAPLIVLGALAAGWLFAGR